MTCDTMKISDTSPYGSHFPDICLLFFLSLFTGATHLSKRSAVRLGNDGKLPAIVRGPSPRRRPATSRAAEGRVRQEVVQVDILAAEEEIRLVPEGYRLAVPALREVQLDIRVVGQSRDALRVQRVPLLELLRHDALMHEAIVVELGGAGRVLGDFLTDGESREGSDGE